jgi:deoxycytidylate deaminase
MNNITSVPISDAVIKNETLESNTTPLKITEKELMDALIKQASYAEDYYRKLVAQVAENLRKTYA